MSEQASVLQTALNKDPRDIILKPVVSEKSYGLIDEGKYTFLVDPRASKTEIKLAIEKIFGVKVASVNTINRVGNVIASGLSVRASSCNVIVAASCPCCRAGWAMVVRCTSSATG